ncbi:hypothetical protein RND81_03G093200 [Saponaria officinalis]|uniref:Uncharacterized protein n=1 Tax=Saponaria officinalis TaxID=3572 RepID=A0AAW1M4X3_SAPOF
MASLSMRCALLNTSRQLKEDSATRVPGSWTLFRCRGSDPVEKDEKLNQGKGTKQLRVVQFIAGAARKVKESLSPKQKGDWKDVLLMSISFAVYVYMSQKIVCAYCVWMSMLGQ